MDYCSLCTTTVQKGDMLSKSQYPQNDKEIVETNFFCHTSVVHSLMYDHVCTQFDIAFVVNALGRYSSNQLGHWKAVKKVIRYLQRTKYYMLTYKRFDRL